MPKLPARGAQAARLYDYVDSNADMKASSISSNKSSFLTGLLSIMAYDNANLKHDEVIL